MTLTLVEKNWPREMGRPWSKCLAIVSGHIDGFPLDLGVNLEEPRRARGWVILCSFGSHSARFQALLYVILASRSPLELLAGGRKTMHGSSDDLLCGGGKRAGSTLSCVGALRSTTLASMARPVIVAFYTVQTAPFTRSRNLAPLGTCCDGGTVTFNDGRGRAGQDLQVVLSLSV